MSEDHIVLLCIATFQVITAFLVYKTHQLTLKVELSSNSMKDALVKATGEASFAAGKDSMRDE
jgi:hypothetical protein